MYLILSIDNIVLSVLEGSKTFKYLLFYTVAYWGILLQEQIKKTSESNLLFFASCKNLFPFYLYGKKTYSWQKPNPWSTSKISLEWSGSKFATMYFTFKMLELVKTRFFITNFRTLKSLSNSLPVFFWALHKGVCCTQKQNHPNGHEIQVCLLPSYVLLKCR